MYANDLLDLYFGWVRGFAAYEGYSKAISPVGWTQHTGSSCQQHVLAFVIKVDPNAISGGMAVLSLPCQYSLRAARRVMYAFHKGSLMAHSLMTSIFSLPWLFMASQESCKIDWRSTKQPTSAQPNL